jgi:GMP synthase (glutamine-hydrolysing)
MLRLLVAEGNTAAGRQLIAESVGVTPAEGYADVLRNIAPDAVVDICTPADGEAGIPETLDCYHGIAITGSPLNIYDNEPASLRQVDFVREAFARGIPMFGSCWGLHVAAVAAGGEVERNPRGREVAFARKICLTTAGRDHSMHKGRALMFDAPAIHSDIVTRVPQGAVVTAWNAMSGVQAAEIRLLRGVFWGVQYHPEYGLQDVAALVRRYGQKLTGEGFFTTRTEVERYAAELLALEVDPQRLDIARQLGLNDDILIKKLRRAELLNWIANQVRPFSEHQPLVDGGVQHHGAPCGGLHQRNARC